MTVKTRLDDLDALEKACERVLDRDTLAKVITEKKRIKEENND